MSGTENDTHDPVDAGLFRPQQESQTPEPNSLGEVQSAESAHLGKDPSLPVEGMYPVLDLITEQGSSGLGNPCFLYIGYTYAHNILVDKVIIAQQSLQEFINALSPGACFSIVNSKMLDDVVPKPFGIYGSKEEIGSAQESLAAQDGQVAGVSVSVVQKRIPQPPSFVPLLSPKSARNSALSSSLPSSLSAPQLGLVLPNRTPTGSGPPSQAPHSPQALSTHVSGDSSLPSLRTLRTLLPFGSGKPASDAATSRPLRSSFASFSPVRRSSTTIERKNSSQFSRPADDGDEAAISIAPYPPSQANPERTRDASSSANTHDSPVSSPVSRLPLDGELGPPVVVFNPEPPLSSELSTILESDLSASSKHLTALDGSHITDLSGNRYSSGPRASLPSPGTDDDEVVAPDTSVPDLSTSQLKEVVMHALKERPSTNGWLTGVVVEDLADSCPTSRNHREAHEGYTEVEPEESLHLDALDPDLAAFLSPNPQPRNLLAPAPIHQNPSAIAPPRIFPFSRAITPQSRPLPSSFSPVDASPSSPTGSTRSQHSPVRTTVHSGLVRSVPTRFVPSLMLSAADNALTGRGDRGVGSFSRTPSDSALQINEGRRVSSDGLYLRRSPASPLPLAFQSQPSLQQTHTVQHRRVASSRLATPARFGTHTSGASCLLHSTLPSSSSSALPTGWGGDSPSPTSRTSSSLGAAADCLNRPRTSEDGAIGGWPGACERLGYIPRGRNRSLSVGDGNGERVTSRGSRTAAEWLGPRTAKAFAAAGLLERDQDPSNSVSHFGSTRSLGDRDQRALSPTRLALSEAGSVVGSWRSASREMTDSDATASTSTGAPRTTRSTVSTAPTSVSMSRTSSPQHKDHRAALHAMQDKHATETGTLLAALADAQHIAQSLRTEGARLTKRVEDLEAQLVAAHHTQLRAPSSAGSSATIPRTHSLGGARLCPCRLFPHTTCRIPPTARSWTSIVKRTRMRKTRRIVAAALRAHRRASDSESVFALPPPNMSMLLQEQPAGSRRSASSVSLATAGAETDGRRSPRSLFLRPEHELHLGDIGRFFTEDDASDDEDG
ncbi:hypothetical protein EDB89DRAFT_2177277 [Lactarius sanguifluus]|nr:hypothetical protein EDB89DRAFT_2177277 [Lactarius sanguifluus]